MKFVQPVHLCISTHPPPPPQKKQTVQIKHMIVELIRQLLFSCNQIHMHNQ